MEQRDTTLKGLEKSGKQSSTVVAPSLSGSGRDETRGLVGVDTLKRRAEALVSPMFIHSFGQAVCRSGLGVAGDRQDAALVGLWSGSADSALRADRWSDADSWEDQSFCSNTSDLLATRDLREPKALPAAQEGQTWLGVTGFLPGILRTSYRTQGKAHSGSLR